MTVFLEKEFRDYLVKNGVGSKDHVADSVQSYVGYLNNIAKHLDLEISSQTLKSEDDIANLKKLLEGKVKPKTISNYSSAMKQYVAMLNNRHDFHCSIEEHMSSEDTSSNKHSIHSSYREKLLEHLFISELLKRSWMDGDCSMEIAKPEVDSRGYDLIAEANGVMRHIQLKSTKKDGKANDQKVHVELSSKPSGCVVWLYFDEQTLQFDSFLFFGGMPKEPLPSMDEMPVAKHTKGNASGEKLERPLIRKVKKSSFERLVGFDALYKRLFG